MKLCLGDREGEVRNDREAKEVIRNYKERHIVVIFFLLSHTQRPIFSVFVLPQSIWMEKDKNNTNVRLYCA